MTEAARTTNGTDTPRAFETLPDLVKTLQAAGFRQAPWICFENDTNGVIIVPSVTDPNKLEGWFQVRKEIGVATQPDREAASATVVFHMEPAGLTTLPGPVTDNTYEDGPHV